MIRGTLHRGDARTWSHRRLTRASAGESHTCGGPTRPPSDSWGLTPPDPRYRSAATRRTHTPSVQRGVGRNPFIPAGLFALVRVGRDRSGGLPAAGRGAEPVHPRRVVCVGACWTGSFRTAFRAAGRGAEPVHPRGVVCVGACWTGSFRTAFRAAGRGAELHRSGGWAGGLPNLTASRRATPPTAATCADAFPCARYPSG